MVRLFKFLLFVCAFAAATFITNFAYAQSSRSTSTPTPFASPLRDIAATASIAQSSDPVTDTEESTDSSESLLVPTPTALATPVASSNITPSQELTPSVNITPATGTGVNAQPLEGTILANRSEVIARFFLEGQTYQLEAGRSQGMKLPRTSTVLNLFNCPGDLDVNTEGCFWDPYLLQQDGFYEIYAESADADPVKLLLREAGAPPTGQVWVQNRTGQSESVVFKEDVYEILPTSVQEFPVSTGVPAILYVRSCLTIDNQSACEWAPKTLNAGVYYAMVELDTPGSQSGSTMTTIDLRPVVGEGEEAATAEVSSAPAIVCSVVVPALNIRSGPGLQYDIIGKVRSTDGSAVTVNVIGRSNDNEWLTVDPALANNGWINNSPSFITCNGDVTGLPIAEAPAPPTPQPIIVENPTPTTDNTVEVPDTTTSEAPVVEDTSAVSPEVTATETTTPTETASAIPDGQGMLVVNNGFQYQMRFTLDQMYRPVDGPSEFDIQPGQSLNILVYPGDVPFTGSTPWSGLSGNASVHVEPNQAVTLWLRFEPEQGGSWVFRWN